MFQSSDDFNIDEDFLLDAFESKIVEQSNIDTDPIQFQPIKKFCPQNGRENFDFNFAVPSSSKAKENLLNIFSKKPTERNVVVVDRNLRGFNRKSPSNNRKVVQRKFPGPAGLLPEYKIDVNIKAIEDNCDTTSNNKTIEPDEIICSQLSDNCFNEGLWEIMCKEYYIDTIKMYLPEKYSISWVKVKSMSKQLLGQKTPFLAAIIKSIDCTIKNPMVVLKDPTGEMAGTLHHEVWDNFSEKLHVGAVMVLRQVGVLTTVKKRYLNITPNNVITIYSYKDFNMATNCENTEKNLNIDTTHVQNFTSNDFLKTIEDYKREYREKQVNKCVDTDNPFFKNNISNNNSLLKANSFISNVDRSVNKENIIYKPVYQPINDKKNISNANYNEEQNRNEIFRKPIESQFSANVNFFSATPSSGFGQIQNRTPKNIPNINPSVANFYNTDKSSNFLYGSENQNFSYNQVNNKRAPHKFNPSATSNGNNSSKSLTVNIFSESGDNFGCNEAFNKNLQNFNPLPTNINKENSLKSNFQIISGPKSGENFSFNRAFNKNLQNLNPAPTSNENSIQSNIQIISEPKSGENFGFNRVFNKNLQNFDPLSTSNETSIQSNIQSILEPESGTNFGFNRLSNKNLPNLNPSSTISNMRNETPISSNFNINSKSGTENLGYNRVFNKNFNPSGTMAADNNLRATNNNFASNKFGLSSVNPSDTIMEVSANDNFSNNQIPGLKSVNPSGTMLKNSDNIISASANDDMSSYNKIFNKISGLKSVNPSSTMLKNREKVATNINFACNKFGLNSVNPSDTIMEVSANDNFSNNQISGRKAINPSDTMFKNSDNIISASANDDLSSYNKIFNKIPGFEKVNPLGTMLKNSDNIISTSANDDLSYNKIFNTIPGFEKVNPSGTMLKNSDNIISTSANDDFSHNKIFQGLNPSNTMLKNIVSTTHNFSNKKTEVKNSSSVFNSKFNLETENFASKNNFTSTNSNVIPRSESERVFNKEMNPQNFKRCPVNENKILDDVKDNILGPIRNRSLATYTATVVENISPNIISETYTQNFMDKFLTNKNVPTFNSSCNKKDSDSVYDLKDRSNQKDSREMDFLTSTQKDNSSQIQSFFDNENILDGLEDSFLEDF